MKLKDPEQLLIALAITGVVTSVVYLFRFPPESIGLTLIFIGLLGAIKNKLDKKKKKLK